jgi:sugar phosphate isomerase/epimerase
VQLGIGTYAFTWAIGVPGQAPQHPLTALAFCRRAVDLGVRVVQFADNLPLTRLDPRTLDEVATFAAEHGLTIELGTRGILSGDLPGHLALARRLRAPFVRLVLDGAGHEPTPDEAIELLRPHVRAFARAGVHLAIENHDRFTSATLARIVEQLGSDHVGITLDTVNSLGALEGPATVLRVLGPYALNLHLKDFVVRRVPSQMGFVVEGCPAGTGRLDVPWLLSELHRLNARVDQVNAVIELWTPPAASLDETIAREAAWVQESVQRLRPLIPA